jgi:hypothetical protein
MSLNLVDFVTEEYCIDLSYESIFMLPNVETNEIYLTQFHFVSVACHVKTISNTSSILFLGPIIDRDVKKLF